MVENPQVRSHRERMQRMHKDFFAILKWQRKKMLQILDTEPEKIIGDVVQLKKDLVRIQYSWIIVQIGSWWLFMSPDIGGAQAAG